MSEPTSELLPLYESSRSFATAMRGYDREAVDREFSRLDDDVRSALSERDSATARSADLAAQLASVHAQLESLRRQLASANEQVTIDNVDDRVKHIFTAARTDAGKLRTDAQAQAEQVRSAGEDAAARIRAGAQTEAERIVAEANVRRDDAEQLYRDRFAAAEQHRADVEVALAESEKRTRAEQDRLTAEATAERTRLDQDAATQRTRLDDEAAHARELATEDFEITLRLRRSTMSRELADQKRSADVNSARILAEARAQARQLIADATHEVRRLHGVRDDTHQRLETLLGGLRGSLDESRAHTPEHPGLPESGASATELDRE